MESCGTFPRQLAAMQLAATGCLMRMHVQPFAAQPCTVCGLTAGRRRTRFFAQLGHSSSRRCRPPAALQPARNHQAYSSFAAGSLKPPLCPSAAAHRKISRQYTGCTGDFFSARCSPGPSAALPSTQPPSSDPNPAPHSVEPASVPDISASPDWQGFVRPKFRSQRIGRQA